MENPKNNFDVIDYKIQTAKDAKKFFITVTYLDRDNKLQHSWVTENFPKEDILKSLNEIEQDIVKKGFLKGGEQGGRA